MRIRTATEAMALFRDLEHEGADFYARLAERHPQVAEPFSGFRKENHDNAAKLERAYYGAISDALEGGFAFDLEPDNFTLDTGVAENASLPEAATKAASLEENMARLYQEAAKQCVSLMSDVARAMELVARKHDRRAGHVRSLLSS